MNGEEIDYYSPILQNLYHIKYLKEFLQPVPYELAFHSIVLMQALSPQGKVVVEGPFPPSSSVVTNVSSLRRITQLICERRNMALTMDEAKYIYDYIGENQLRGEDARARHAAESTEYKLHARKALTHQICPACQAQLTARATPRGNYWVCSRWPECSYTHKM